MSSNLFEGARLSESTPQKLMQIALKIKAISNFEDVKLILCAMPFPTASNFILCTNDEIIYVVSNFLLKFNKYPYLSITGVTQESPSIFKNLVSITIGGSEKITFDIVFIKDDAVALSDFIKKQIADKKAVTNVSIQTVADELKKFKELLDMGAITDEEFTMKKKQLLNI